jgi:hypothetical protein
MVAKYKPVKVLSALEVEERMELGLCFLCDELFTPYHAMKKHKSIQVKVIKMDDEINMDFSQNPSTLK